MGANGNSSGRMPAPQAAVDEQGMEDQQELRAFRQVGDGWPVELMPGFYPDGLLIFYCLGLTIPMAGLLLLGLLFHGQIKAAAPNGPGNPWNASAVSRQVFKKIAEVRIRCRFRLVLMGSAVATPNAGGRINLPLSDWRKTNRGLGRPLGNLRQPNPKALLAERRQDPR